MKKWITVFLTCIMAFTASAGAAFAEETTQRIPCSLGEPNCAIYRFKDVSGDEDGWHSVLEFVLSHDIMDGTSEDTFSPDQTLTRAQFLTMLYRMFNRPEAPEATQFTDLTQDWYN